MFKHVLVPVDGSRFSERAIDYATQLLAGGTGELSLVIVVPNYLAASFPGANLPGAAELGNRQKQLAEQYVAQKAHEVSSLAGVPAKGVALKGSPAEEISEFAASTRADLIVISSHGITTSSTEKDTVRLGSVAFRVMSIATCPVLLLRPSV
jgi:nucleotide-binding universal stress UspA family protein